MDIFIEETPNDLVELEKNYNNLNYKKVKEICHKLKGLFKSYNMMELTKYTIDLETYSKSETFPPESIEILNKIKEDYKKNQLEMIDLKNKYKS